MAFSPKRFLAESGPGRTIMVYKSGTHIFRQGDPAETIFYVQAGTAKETVTSDVAGSTKEALTTMLEPGMFFGTGAVLVGQRRRSRVTTVTTCQFMIYNRDTIIQALEEPAFVQLFMEFLLERNRRIEAEKADLLLNSQEKRLAQKLLQLSHADRGPPQRIGPEITQEMLAEMIGTTRPRANFFLNKFRRAGYIVSSSRAGITVMSTLVKVLAAEESTEE